MQPQALHLKLFVWTLTCLFVINPALSPHSFLAAPPSDDGKNTMSACKIDLKDVDTVTVHFMAFDAQFYLPVTTENIESLKGVREIRADTDSYFSLKLFGLLTQGCRESSFSTLDRNDIRAKIKAGSLILFVGRDGTIEAGSRVDLGFKISHQTYLEIYHHLRRYTNVSDHSYKPELSPGNCPTDISQ